MKQIPASQVFAPRREPCAECGMPVFIAERLRIPHTPRTQNGGEEDSGGGKSNPPNQQSFLLMHRTCFRCARCHQQLSPAGGYYETESGAFCCEVCPDEERPSSVPGPVRSIRGDPEGTLAAGTDDEASDPEDEGDAVTGSNMDSYSEDFESALEASGGGVDSSPAHAMLPIGDSSFSSGTRIPSDVQVSDGAISSNTKSSSNSSFLSVKSHHESSPVVQHSGKVPVEDGAKADDVGIPSEREKEAEEPESQSSEPDAPQFTQRLHPIDVKENRGDDGLGEVVLRKKRGVEVDVQNFRPSPVESESQLCTSDASQFAQRLHTTDVIEKRGDDGSGELKKETDNDGGEVDVPCVRPFSVLDRVRMFDREVKVRQPSPKDGRLVFVKEKDKNERESVGNSVKKEATSGVVDSSLTTKSSNKVGNYSSEMIYKIQRNGTPEKKGNEVKDSVEDIPFMDDSADISHNEEMIDLSPKEATDLSSKDAVKDIPLKESNVPCKEASEFPCEKEVRNVPCKVEVVDEEAAKGSGGEAKASAISVEPLAATRSEGDEKVGVIVSTLEDKTESVGELDHRKQVEDSIQSKGESIEVKEHLEGDVVKVTKEDAGDKKDIEESAQKMVEELRDTSEEGTHLSGEGIKVIIESPKDEEDGKLAEKKGDVVKVVPKHSEKIEYPEGLNPFGEDDEEDERKVAEVVRKKIIPVPSNPFGSSDEDEEEEIPIRRKLPVPAVRRSFNALDSLGRTDRPSSEDRTNPFWSAGEEDDGECQRERVRRKSQSNITDTDRPVPKPRTVWSSVTSTPEPSPLPRRGASPCQSAESTLTRRRKKKPAPPPPMQQTPQPLPRASTPTPQPPGEISVQSSPSPSISTTTSPGGTPRRPRKSRPAPRRPVTPLDSPSSVKDNVPLLPLNSSQDNDSPETVESVPTTEETELKTSPTSSPSTRPPPESEKRQKDAENRNRRSRTSGGEEEEPGKDGIVAVVSEIVPDKSTYGQWKRKKGPAPPRPMPQKRKLNPHVPISEIRRELCDIEVQQMELERQGVALERAIRSRFQQEDSPNDAWIPAEVEAQVLQLFELVNEKNELFRRQAELMYMRRQQRLEEEHADLEFQIRCLMERPASLKTDADKEREETLIQRLVEVVQARDEVVQCLESDRLREAQEDVTVRARLAGAFPGKAAEKGEVEEDVEEEAALGEKGKKSKKEKKVWERMKKKVVGKKGSGGVLHLGKGKRKKDADKDVDEVEEEGKRKEGGAW